MDYKLFNVSSEKVSWGEYDIDLYYDPKSNKWYENNFNFKPESYFVL